MTTGTGNWIETEMAIEELGCAQHRVKIKMKTKAHLDDYDDYSG